MPVFELLKLSGKRIALVRADEIEAIFEYNGKMTLSTIDGKIYPFYTFMIFMTDAIGSDKQPEYYI